MAVYPLLDFDDVMNYIRETLAEADEDFIAGIFNKVCSDQIKPSGDSLWIVYHKEN